MNEAQYVEFLQKKLARRIQREQGIKYTAALRFAQALPISDIKAEFMEVEGGPAGSSMGV